jgi:hypothetical protein
MAYQKCPICVGNGYENLEKPCTVCKGKKIVCELTGEPPQGEQLPKKKQWEEVDYIEWPKIIEEKDRVVLQGKPISNRPPLFPFIQEFEKAFTNRVKNN